MDGRRGWPPHRTHLQLKPPLGYPSTKTTLELCKLNNSSAQRTNYEVSTQYVPACITRSQPIALWHCRLLTRGRLTSGRSHRHGRATHGSTTKRHRTAQPMQSDSAYPDLSNRGQTARVRAAQEIKLLCPADNLTPKASSHGRRRTKIRGTPLWEAIVNSRTLLQSPHGASIRCLPLSQTSPRSFVRQPSRAQRSLYHTTRVNTHSLLQQNGHSRQPELASTP